MDIELHITQAIQELSTVGGSWRVAWELAKAFSRAGISNSVVTSKVVHPVDPATTVHLVAKWLRFIPTKGIFRHLGTAMASPMFTLAATYALRQQRNSIVISHGETLQGDAVVVHAVNAENLIEKRRAGSWYWLLNPMHLWVGLRDRWMIGGLRFPLYLAVSPRTSAELQRHYNVPPTRIRVIPNGVDTTRFSRDPAAGRAVRQEFGVPPSAKVLVFVGNEFRRKGLANAIGAVRRLGSDVYLLVVGADNPEPYRHLAGPARDRVIFAGKRADVSAFYSAANALILPTSYETFSLVCMEAMACGVPVFATRVGGIEDYLKDGFNGYGISLDPDEITRTIASVIGDQPAMDRMSEGARATAANFQWDRIASEYVNVAYELLRARQKHAADGFAGSRAVAQSAHK